MMTHRSRTTTTTMTMTTNDRRARIKAHNAMRVRYKNIMRLGIFPDSLLDNTMLLLKDRDYKTYEDAYRLYTSNPSPLTIQYEDDKVTILPDDDIEEYDYLLDEIPDDRNIHAYFHFVFMTPEKGKGLSERQMLFVARLYQRIARRLDNNLGRNTKAALSDFYESVKYNLVGIPSDKLITLRAIKKAWEDTYKSPFDILIDGKDHEEYLLDGCAHGLYNRYVRVIPKNIATGRKDSLDATRTCRLYRYKNADLRTPGYDAPYIVYDPAGIDDAISLARKRGDKTPFPYLFAMGELFHPDTLRPLHLNLNFKKLQL